MSDRTQLATILPVCLLLACLLVVSAELRAQSVTTVPQEIRKQFQLDPFYKKHIDVDGLPIVGSQMASDAALEEAAWIVNRMIGHRPEILAAMASNSTRLAVMAYNEFTTDLPEHRHLTPRIFWDRRARGLGATPSAPAVSCAEENLLEHPNDPYFEECICIHEFAHAIHQMGMKDIDPTFDKRLRKAFEQATKTGKWKNTYAAGNHMEYWAEGVQSWFDDNRENDALHNHVNTRPELIKYDPSLAKLCQEVFGDFAWRYQKPSQRANVDKKHLQGILAENLPRFEWRKENIPDKPKVLIQTTEGDIELEIDAKKAPLTARNFLHYVHVGLYSDGNFHRSVTPTNQENSKVKIQVIQGGANTLKRKQFLPAIVLETTEHTGLKHLNGVISMARTKTNSATDQFFICIEDQPELDFGGRRNPDGQGFAAFGRVTKGMEVVKQIQNAPSDKQSLDPKIMIQRAIRLN
jgi:cyclophilin family peptidyl-prolyl cis-trans isomerase